MVGCTIDSSMTGENATDFLSGEKSYDTNVLGETFDFGICAVVTPRFLVAIGLSGV